MVNNAQYVSHSFTLPGARTHAHALIHSPLPAGRAMQRPTYPISLFLSPQWGGGGNNSALTQPFPCEHKRP